MPLAAADRGTARTLLISLIRCYQRFVSPFTGPTCRFYPSCSEYALQAIRTYGAVRGVGKAAVRLCKCHPFHPGGYDPLH
ncbi:MAG TPA: membrane protein insertion efficiency factor YidD [Geobacteraceae bacterium]